MFNFALPWCVDKPRVMADYVQSCIIVVCQRNCGMVRCNCVDWYVHITCCLNVLDELDALFILYISMVGIWCNWILF